MVFEVERNHISMVPGHGLGIKTEQPNQDHRPCVKKLHFDMQITEQEPSLQRKFQEQPSYHHGNAIFSPQERDCNQLNGVRHDLLHTRSVHAWWPGRLLKRVRTHQSERCGRMNEWDRTASAVRESNCCPCNGSKSSATAFKVSQNAELTMP